MALGALSCTVLYSQSRGATYLIVAPLLTAILVASGSTTSLVSPAGWAGLCRCCKSTCSRGGKARGLGTTSGGDAWSARIPMAAGLPARLANRGVLTAVRGCGRWCVSEQLHPARMGLCGFLVPQGTGSATALQVQAVTVGVASSSNGYLETALGLGVVGSP